MQIRFQESDLSILETHPLTPGLTLAGLPAQVSVTASATAGPEDSTATTATFGQFTTIPTPTPPPVIVGTPSPPPTETSRADPSAAQSNMTIPSNPTTTAVAIPSNEKTGGKGQSSTSIAAIVLSTLLSLFAVAFTVYACFKGRQGRRRRFWKVSTGRRKGLMPVGVGVWIGTRGSDESDEEVAYEHRVNTTRFSTPAPDTPTSSVPRETGSGAPQIPRSVISRGSSPSETEGGIRIPIFGQAQFQRLRVKLPGAELYDSHEGTPSRHGSWVSRVSRMLSRAARSSTTSRSSSRSRSRSGRTTRRPASEEWEHFFQGRGGPGGLTVPNLTYTRPSSTASSSSYMDDRKDDFFDLEDEARQLPKIISFDRLSEGTFGMRGRSSDRSAKRKS